MKGLIDGDACGDNAVMDDVPRDRRDGVFFLILSTQQFSQRPKILPVAASSGAELSLCQDEGDSFH